MFVKDYPYLGEWLQLDSFAKLTTTPTQSNKIIEISKPMSVIINIFIYKIFTPKLYLYGLVYCHKSQ